jgi:very-short-patch-repair endonuclease
MRGPDRFVVGKARRLRRDSTIVEMQLWLAIRSRRLEGFKFVRQDAVGPCIVDFVCRERKLIVEVDGGQHADSNSDRVRDAYLASEGFRVLRFWNNDVLSNKEDVLTAILSALQTDKS